MKELQDGPRDKKRTKRIQCQKDKQEERITEGSC
jgi:hypothetical protein